MSTVAPTLPGIETPPQSLRLPGAVWGFDCSTTVIALAIVNPQDDDTPEVGTFIHGVRDRDKGARRLAALHDDLRPFLERFLPLAPPIAVLVEQPFGQGKARPHPQSYYIVSVVLTALAQALPDECAIGVIDPSSWKRDSMGDGHGFATKREILGWALAHGLAHDCHECHGEGEGDCPKAGPAHDEADALGVATAAAVRWAASGRLR